MKDEVVYTVLAVLGVCAVVILSAGALIILGTVITSWLGLAVGAVL